jgi:hypothetical protein
LCAVEIFDYDHYYLPHINAMLAHHSIPHQFSPAVDVDWLPWGFFPAIATSTDQLNPSLFVLEETSAQPKNVKKRKFTRGAVKPHLKKKKIVAMQADSHSSDDKPNEPPHDFYLPEFALLQLLIQGILWLTSLPDADCCPGFKMYLYISFCKVISWKAVIFCWHDEEDGNYYIWLAIVCSVVSNPSSHNCQLKVKWCPPAKQYQFQARISAEDTFESLIQNTQGQQGEPANLWSQSTSKTVWL